ncbi:hypothetical protein AMTRI_Chr05g65950 [Amborella trichopoda]
MGLRVNLEKTKMTRICLDQARVKCFTDSWGCAIEPSLHPILAFHFSDPYQGHNFQHFPFLYFFFMPTVVVARLKKLMRALRLLNALKGQVKEVKPQA